MKIVLWKTTQGWSWRLDGLEPYKITIARDHSFYFNSYGSGYMTKWGARRMAQRNLKRYCKGQEARDKNNRLKETTWESEDVCC